ncbi:MAG: hypothetical protein V7K50_23225 [Nostoc sp.]|uniref:hypothetical protein n=1 Tax=Nostoc sp. TaxID=1180 RepID=UPI002FFA7A38
MNTAIKEITVSDLIQELQNLPGDVPVTLKDNYAETLLIVGFEAGSDGVTIFISDDSESEPA